MTPVVVRIERNAPADPLPQCSETSAADRPAPTTTTRHGLSGVPACRAPPHRAQEIGRDQDHVRAGGAQRRAQPAGLDRLTREDESGWDERSA